MSSSWMRRKPSALCLSWWNKDKCNSKRVMLVKPNWMFLPVSCSFFLAAKKWEREVSWIQILSKDPMKTREQSLREFEREWVNESWVWELKLTPRPLFKGRMAGHHWERPGSTASDRWKKLGPLAVGRGPADPRVRPNPRWAPLLTARAHCPSNGHKLFRLWCRPNFASKRCSNLFFKGFSCLEIFLDFWKNMEKC